MPFKCDIFRSTFHVFCETHNTYGIVKYSRELNEPEIKWDKHKVI